MFARITTPTTPVTLHLGTSTSAQAQIPANVFGKVKVVSFTMFCVPSFSTGVFRQAVQPVIDPNAFSLSTMNYISLIDCDFANQKNFNFLSGFNNSISAGAELSMFGDINLQGFSVIPKLPGLSKLQFDSCDLRGLIEAGFPDVSPAKLNTFSLRGPSQGSSIGTPLTDTQLSAIVTKLGASSSASSLNDLILPNNNLTQIPTNLKSFTNLSTLGLTRNKIQSLKAGQLALPSALKYLDLSFNDISTIQPSFFNQFNVASQRLVGYEATINLNFNQLTHFPSNVFQPLLQKLASVNTTVSLSNSE